MAMIRQTVISSDGHVVPVWIDTDAGDVAFGIQDGCRFPIPRDRDDLLYSRGGEMYRQACDRYWDLEARECDARAPCPA